MTADFAQQQALTTAERLLRIDDVMRHVPDPAGGSLGRGLAGTALLHARLSQLDTEFALAATAHWARASELAKQGGGNGAGLYHNPGGLAAALIIGTPYLPDPEPQMAATARAVSWLSARATQMARQHGRYLQTGGVGTPWHVYDVITGLAGIGRVLLAATRSGHADAESGLLDALRTLTTMIHTRYGERPGWWLPAQQHPTGVEVHASGAANTGMAHGIAGPLALLSLAHVAGLSVPAQETAIREAADWLLRWRIRHNLGWSPQITGDELETGHAAPIESRGDAWCYGIPGISRALTLAGHAIGDPRFIGAAKSAIASLVERGSDQWDVEGSTLCHGYAGALQATATDPEASRQATAAVTQLFNPAHPFCFRHIEKRAACDNPGFLDGAAGVALVLAEHAGLSATPVSDPWDALLLLA